MTAVFYAILLTGNFHVACRRLELPTQDAGRQYGFQRVRSTYFETV